MTTEKILEFARHTVSMYAYNQGTEFNVNETRVAKLDGPKIERKLATWIF